MTDTDNLNLFGKDARLPGGPNDKNPTARHEDAPVPGADPEADKDLQATDDREPLTPTEADDSETPAEADTAE